MLRPTGLIDPEVEGRQVKGQIDDLLHEIRERVSRAERVLVTTLTKRMAEDLAEYYGEVGVKCRYLHSEIETLERVKILRDLRKGEFDVLIGINLLREGLDLPEVSLVAILDADKEGFLRSAGSLIQTIGRCARNLNGRAILYADRMTDSMKKALDETNRRRAIQQAYNEENGITPESIIRPLDMTGWHRGRRLCRPDRYRSRRHPRTEIAGRAGRLHRKVGKRYARSGKALRIREGGETARHDQGTADKGILVRVATAALGCPAQNISQPR